MGIFSVFVNCSYKFAAKTHMLACGMKAASLWFDDNIDKIYKICINKTYHSDRGGFNYKEVK